MHYPFGWPNAVLKALTKPIKTLLYKQFNHFLLARQPVPSLMWMALQSAVQVILRERQFDLLVAGSYGWVFVVLEFSVAPGAPRYLFSDNE
jgi:hypothetical protein